MSSSVLPDNGTNQRITMTIEDSVCAKIQKRREKGISKYGISMDRTDLTEVEWLVHAQEEAMDLVIYLEKLITNASVPGSSGSIVPRHSGVVPQP